MIYPPKTFFADFAEEIRFLEHLRGLGISVSPAREVVHFHHPDVKNLDARVLCYLVDRGFVQESRVDSEQHCFTTFQASEVFCACSRIYNPMLNSWWYSILLSRVPTTPEMMDESTGWSAF
jgi:hypothetical protein